MLYNLIFSTKHLPGGGVIDTYHAAKQHKDDTVEVPTDKEDVEWMYRVHASEFDLNSPVQAPTLRDVVRENAGMFLDEGGATPAGMALLEYLDVVEPEAHLYDVYRDLGGVPKVELDEIAARNAERVQIVIRTYSEERVVVKIGNKEVEVNLARDRYDG